jgi:hypothetical protein
MVFVGKPERKNHLKPMCGGEINTRLDRKEMGREGVGFGIRYKADIGRCKLIANSQI